MTNRIRVTTVTRVETHYYFLEDEIAGLDDDEIMELINDRSPEPPAFIETYVDEKEDY